MATPTSKPTRKVIAGGLTGTFVTLVVLILNTYVPVFEQKPISGVIAGLATTLISAIVAYLIPPAPEETTILDTNGRCKTALKQPT